MKEGDVFDGSSWLLSITQEGKNPVLRADLSNVERNIVEGTTVNISTTRYGTLETQVLAAGTAPEGGKYADVEITQDMLDALGSVYSLTQTETPMSLVYRAKENTCLLPSSAVHGTGDERYVFVVNKEYNSFGNSSMKVAKYAVTVLGEVDGTVSIQEDISYYTLAYMEDRQIKDGDSVKKGDRICEWDAYNATTIVEVAGTLKFENMAEGVTYRKDSNDEFSASSDKVIIDSKDRTKSPAIDIVGEDGTILKQYNLPVGAHVMVEDGAEVKIGDVIIKIPRAFGKASDITGGLPRVTELFEARNPSASPSVLSEINGQVIMGTIKRGNREIIIRNRSGLEKHYLVPLSKQILVQEDDYVKAGTPLSDGGISPSDILAILGPVKAQEYIVNEVQAVYRLQGVKINDKHFEIIVRQMMRKVEITNHGDTQFLEEELVDKMAFMDANDAIFGKFVVLDPGDSEKYQEGQIIGARELHSENESLARQGLKTVNAREARPATARLVLQGITRAALRTNSFISAASFQETTKVLSEAAIRGRVDHLEGLKENVICGHLIPAGTGLKDYQDIVVGRKDEAVDELNEL